MSRDDSIFLIYNDRRNSNIFKMTKTKTALFLVMVVCSCGLIFSITDAYPTYESNEAAMNETKLGNNSRLVITHVVKTIEFEVGVVDDDGIVNENSTDSETSQFYETDIQLLNVDLLKEVVKQATEEENWEATIQSNDSLSQNANEEKTQQMENVSVRQSNQTNS